MWYGEGEHWNYTAAEPIGQNNTDHFTLMMWVNTTMVGFGYSSNKDHCYAVAQYDIPGNIEGEYASNVRPPMRR